MPESYYCVLDSVLVSKRTYLELKKIIHIFQIYLGAIQKVCHRPRGGGGSSKIVTKCDNGGREDQAKE